MDRQGTSSEKILEENKYTPAGERGKSHGNFFHWQQLMSILCKCISSYISFTITCEIEEAGKFDDIVIFYKSDEKSLCRLIQIKHRENIKKVLTFNDLIKNKNFQLKTYFDSYVKIKNDIKFEQEYGCEIEELIICTNVDFDDDLKERMEAVPDSIFIEDVFYRLKETSKIEFIKESNDKKVDAIREEFFRKLRFAVKQSDEDDLKNGIKSELLDYLENEHPNDSYSSDRLETIYVNLITKIIYFGMNQKVQDITNEGYLNWLEEAINSKENQLSVYHKYNLCVLAAHPLQFERDSLEELEKSVTQNESSLSLVISCADTIFTVQKLVQIFNLQNLQFRLIFGKQVVASTCNIRRDFSSADRCEYLVVVCKSNKKSENVFKTVKKIHDWIIKDSILNKRIVLVSDPTVRSEIYLAIFGNLVKFEDHVAWNDLDKQTKNHILEKQIVFQGQLVSFKTIDISHIQDSIKDRVLFDIALSDKYEIGKFHDSKTDGMSYFVPRRIIVDDYMKNPFKISESDHLFAIENIDKARFENFMLSVSLENRSRYFRLNDKMAAENFQEISRVNKDKNVTWIHFEFGRFRWKKSSRSISVIKQYLLMDFRCDIELQTVSDIENKSVLVIGEPGMGKTTLLSRLATRSIERSPDVWVIKINLNSHTGYFKKLLDDSETFFDKNDVIEFITGTQNLCGFEKALFESYFRIENKLVILLDGFDEIAPHYRDVVIKLVKIIQSFDKIKVWITSRPHERGFLEEQLVVLPFYISEFTDEDQRKFFKMFWEKYVDKTDSQMERLETFVYLLLNVISKSLYDIYDYENPTSIPLLCKILADVYTDTFIKFYKKETYDLKILDSLDICDLYKRFIDIKCKINIEEKRENDITKPGNIDLVEKKIKKINSRYKLLCLSAVFGKEDEKMLLNEESEKIIETSLSAIEKGFDKYGIVRSVENGIPVFVHRTFAEYFAALYLRDFVDDEKNKNDDRVAFVRRTLFDPTYMVVHRFFDRLTGTDDIFKYALNGDKEQLKTILKNDRNAIHRTDEFGRNVLHLIAGYDHTANVCKYLIESGADPTQKDELFGWKPVEYAIKLKLWENVYELIIGNENDEVISRSIEDKEELMFTAGKKGWTRLIKYLVEIGKISVDIKDKDEISTLHSAVMNGHVETCRYLIEMGAKIKCDLVDESYLSECYNYNIYENETLFHFAIRNGFNEIVKLFIESDRNIIEHICYKETLLHKAMESGNVEILRFLVDRGANVNSVNEEGETPLHVACRNTNIDVIDFLLERGANIEALDCIKCNPLMKYVEVGNVAVVRHLLAKGADIYCCDICNMTVLHHVTFYSRLNILKVLIAHDPNIVRKIRFSETLLHEAMTSTNIEIIEQLIENGADVNGRNEKGETPLHIANENTSIAAIELLLKRGADVEARDNDGKTPIMRFEDCEYVEAFKLLRTYIDKSKK